ncbi:TetR family transcriptional regulator [Nonomuraea sp. NPDC050404]|uniref:TetR/AcrR family transcriptional regulator n=1 Tax=Nonomuraea sp. NPDC050404 TaxID=3155783 RepID=UPI0034067334
MSTGGPEASLRARKKAKTKSAIQREALRLFDEQGYEATTVEEIVDAVDVSRATFFRYFPTKADIVLHDVGDLLVVQAMKRLPASGHPIDSLRLSIQRLFDEASEAGLSLNRRREELLRRVPELRARVPGHMAQAIPLLATALAAHSGRSADDVDVLTMSGAIIGVAIAIWTATADDVSDGFVHRHLTLLDLGLARLRGELLPAPAHDAPTGRATGHH